MFKLNVFDVSAFVYKGTMSQNYGTRTYYGYPVGGIHYLMRYVATSLVQSDSVVLMFDGRNNFRRSVYLDYKANRVCNPAVTSQIESLWDANFMQHLHRVSNRIETSIFLVWIRSI